MTKREFAVNLVKKSLEADGAFREFESYDDYVYTNYGPEGGKEFKGEVAHILKDYANTQYEKGIEGAYRFFDWETLELYEDDGSEVSYRKWVADVKKLWNVESSPEPSKMKEELEKAVDALREARDNWENTDEACDAYPSYLPSFDEFVMDFMEFVERVE